MIECKGYTVITDSSDPCMIMLCGLPGSGKSYLTRYLFVDTPSGQHQVPAVHSSDAIRQELLGDANDQSQTQRIFQTLHKRIRRDLMDGKHVIYDATNLHRKQRRAFLQSLQKIPCQKICILMATEYALCCQRNKQRERTVPQEVMKDMVRSFQPPAYTEGFDKICLLYTTEQFAHKRPFDSALYFQYEDEARLFDQHNEHHTKTLHDHCICAAQHVMCYRPIDTVLSCAALLHDCGKPMTQTYYNAKGELDGNCHYYGHDNAGAYRSLFLAPALNPAFDDDDVLYIANLIAYHMRPYTAWKSSEKAYQRDLRMCGRYFIEDVELLHEADMAAK